ncbi:MAG: type I-F CRISPR-associated endoribonuclease Cas6/Csy4 [Cycloclasticus sp.]|jgi:CRISPR-associated protein, Csy4 family
MDSYLDIKALPNPEIIQSSVIAHLMQQLHKLLPSFDGRIGLAFPAYGQQRTLGGIIRVLGEGKDVDIIYQQLQEIKDVTGYAVMTAIEPIPTMVNEYARYTRVHAKGNSRVQRLKRRHQAAGTWTEELAANIAKKYSQSLNLPHVSLNSASSGQVFILFVRRDTVQKKGEGLFNAYGLSLISSNAAVPVF